MAGKKIRHLDRDMNIIAKLDDEPNDVGGLSSADLKAKFDDSGNVIKTYLNEILIPDIEGTGPDAPGIIGEDIKKHNEAPDSHADIRDEIAQNKADVDNAIALKLDSATIKSNGIPEITSAETLRSYFYGRRKETSRSWQFEVSSGSNENMVAALGGFPDEHTASEKWFLYINLPYSEAGGFVIHAQLEGRDNGLLYRQDQFATLDQRWHTTGWTQIRDVQIDIDEHNEDPGAHPDIQAKIKAVKSLALTDFGLQLPATVGTPTRAKLDDSQIRQIEDLLQYYADGGPLVLDDGFSRFNSVGYYRDSMLGADRVAYFAGPDGNSYRVTLLGLSAPAEYNFTVEHLGPVFDIHAVGPILGAQKTTETYQEIYDAYQEGREMRLVGGTDLCQLIGAEPAGGGRLAFQFRYIYSEGLVPDNILYVCEVAVFPDRDPYAPANVNINTHMFDKVPNGSYGKATDKKYGTVKAAPATDEDTQPVHIKEDGTLATQPSPGSIYATCADEAASPTSQPNTWYVSHDSPRPSGNVGMMVDVFWKNGRTDGIGYDVSLVWGAPGGADNETIVGPIGTSESLSGEYSIPTEGTVRYQLIEQSGRMRWQYVSGKLLPKQFSSATAAATADKAVPGMEIEYLPGMEAYVQMDNGNTAEVMRLVPDAGPTLPVYGNGTGAKTGDIPAGYILHLVNAGDHWQIINQYAAGGDGGKSPLVVTVDREGAGGYKADYNSSDILAAAQAHRAVIMRYTDTDTRQQTDILLKGEKDGLPLFYDTWLSKDKTTINRIDATVDYNSNVNVTQSSVPASDIKVLRSTSATNPDNLRFFTAEEITARSFLGSESTWDATLLPSSAFADLNVGQMVWIAVMNADTRMAGYIIGVVSAVSADSCTTKGAGYVDGFPREPVTIQSDWNVNDDTDPAFVKNRPFYVSDEVVDVVVVPEAAFQFSDSISDFPALSVTAGQQYTVSWDGVDYTTVCTETIIQGVKLVYIGNPEVIGLPSQPFPFAYVDDGEHPSWFTASSEASHNIGVKIKGKKIYRIAEKFLPETIADKLKTVPGEKTIQGGDLFIDYTYSTAGQDATCCGVRSKADGKGSFVTGIYNETSQDYSTIFGEGNSATNTHQLVIGRYVKALASDVLAVGGRPTSPTDGGRVFSVSDLGLTECRGRSRSQRGFDIIGPGDSPDRPIKASLNDTSVVLTSSTPGSAKRFKISVDDTGTIKAEEIV